MSSGGMMANGKTTYFYAVLIAVASIAVGMVLASRLDLAPASSAQSFAAPPMNSAPLSGAIDATTFREIARAVSPAVVNIRTETRRQTQGLEGPGGDLLERFFGLPQPPQGQPRERTVRSAGTGFIVDKAGFILTNNHVVEGTNRIIVSMYGEDNDYEYEARIVGRDPLTDSALLELTEKPDHELPVVRFGDSAQIEPGDWVMAIGNPFGLAHTVSVGVVSGNRPGQLEVSAGRYANVIQTDAAINPGNSGGPLLNIRGEVIGINTAIYADARQGGNIGIGFAIPSNSVRELLPQLREGKVTRGRIGVNIRQVPREAVEGLGLGDRRGALIEAVEPGGAASRAGLEAGDVIVAYNNQPVRGNNDLVEMVMNTRPGTNVPVTVVRNGREQQFAVAPDELDLEAEAAGARGPGGGRTPEPQEQTSQNFGITIQDVTPDVARRLQLPAGQRGAVITNVQPESPAARAQLRSGDVIVRIGDQAVTSVAEAEARLSEVPAGGTVFLRVVREGTERFVILTRE